MRVVFLFSIVVVNAVFCIAGVVKRRQAAVRPRSTSDVLVSSPLLEQPSTSNYNTITTTATSTAPVFM